MKIYSKHIVFKDIVNMLYHSIKTLGYKVSITDKIMDTDELYILVGVAEFPANRTPKNYIVYQFEQSGVSYKNSKNKWFTSKYIQLLDSATYIWDYSKSNIEFLKEHLHRKDTLYYVPLRYSSILDQFPKNKKTIDILFLGSINSRRKTILDRLSLRYNVHIGENNLWGQERDKLISKSKIVLNIQFYENGLLELARLSYLLSGGAFVLSEWGREIGLREEMSSYTLLSTYDHIESLVDTYIHNDILRIETQKTYIENWRKTSYTDVLRSNIIKCLENSEKGIRKKKGTIKYYIPESIKSVDFNVSSEGYCTLTLPNIEDRDLPYVSIITPTKNRQVFFKLAIHHFNHFIYPKDKLEWVIVDNGTEPIKHLLPNDSRIKYIPLDNTLHYTIGHMRNKCIENATYDIICYMDDDDVYRPESILARVKSLIKYKKEGVECVGCTQVGCFNIVNGQSVIGTNHSMYLSEASMAHTKNFWLKRMYDNRDLYGEFKHFLLYRQREIRAIPYQYIMIALNHTRNTTGNSRTVINYTEWMTKHNRKGDFSFYTMFSEEVKKYIMEIIKNLY